MKPKTETNHLDRPGNSFREYCWYKARIKEI